MIPFSRKPIRPEIVRVAQDVLFDANLVGSRTIDEERKNLEVLGRFGLTFAKLAEVIIYLCENSEKVDDALQAFTDNFDKAWILPKAKYGSDELRNYPFIRNLCAYLNSCLHFKHLLGIRNIATLLMYAYRHLDYPKWEVAFKMFHAHFEHITGEESARFILPACLCALFHNIAATGRICKDEEASVDRLCLLLEPVLSKLKSPHAQIMREIIFASIVATTSFDILTSRGIEHVTFIDCLRDLFYKLGDSRLLPRLGPFHPVVETLLKTTSDIVIDCRYALKLPLSAGSRQFDNIIRNAVRVDRPHVKQFFSMLARTVQEAFNEDNESIYGLLALDFAPMSDVCSKLVVKTFEKSRQSKFDERRKQERQRRRSMLESHYDLDRIKENFTLALNREISRSCDGELFEQYKRLILIPISEALKSVDLKENVMLLKAFASMAMNGNPRHIIAEVIPNILRISRHALDIKPPEPGCFAGFFCRRHHHERVIPAAGPTPAC